MRFLASTGIGLNIAASILIDAFYHPAEIGIGWSTWGATAWTLRFIGTGFCALSLFVFLNEKPEE